MAQLNLNMTPEFEKELQNLMKSRQFKSKAETIRIAIKECLERSLQQKSVIDFDTWIGKGNKKPQNKNPKFKKDDDLW